MAGALCAGTWRRQVHDEPAPPDERGGVTAGHRPGPRGRSGVGPIPWPGQRLSGSDIAAELFLGLAACVMSLDPVSAL